MENNTIIDDTIINEEKEINLASRGLRFANFLIDYLIIISLVVFTGSFLFSDELLNNRMFSNLIGFLYYFAYYFIFETATKGKTPGKFITRTRAVMENGELATTMDFLKRSLSRLIPFEQFSIFGNAAWHDSIADTVVVKE